MSTDDGVALDRTPERPLARFREFVPAGAGVLVVALTWLFARELPAAEGQAGSFGPAWWPMGICGLLLALSVVQAVSAWRYSRAGSGQGTASATAAGTAAGTAAAGEPDAELPEPATRSGAVRLVLMLVAIGGYGVLWYYIDFRVSTTILFVALSYLAGVRGWKALLLFPVLATAVLWLLFGVLARVPI